MTPRALINQNFFASSLTDAVNALSKALLDHLDQLDLKSQNQISYQH